MWSRVRTMKRSFNLTGRIFVLISGSLGLALWIAKATGALCTSPSHTLVGGLIFSVVLAWGVSRLQSASWRGLSEAVRESERSGRFTPNFPTDSSLAEANRQAAALNAAARSILNSQADLDRTYLQFVETMAQALDARDPYTAGHSLRVAEYSRTLALAMGLSKEDAETIHVAAQLHDIGKIGIPDAVLMKPGKLSQEEYGLIKLHPQIGRKILEKVARFKELLPVVELHHENHDGSGYPYGLKGLSVPIEARIVHIADSFDAMTTNRSYRNALTLRAAILEIEGNAGGQFDPVAAKAFLGLIAEGAIEVGGLRIAAPRESGTIVAMRDRLAV
jgi:HD-GYP domain-containing protein (c-di-GMP phosphodiesterase class II)